MDALRWIMLAVGIVIIAVVYFTGRRTRRDVVDEISTADPVVPLPTDEPRVEIRRRPTEIKDVDRELAQLSTMIAENRRGDSAADAIKHSSTAPAAPAKTQVARPASPIEDKIIVLYVMAPPGGRFAGADVCRAVEAAGLRHGQMQIFHRSADPAQPDSAAVFSLANMVQPGTFDLDRLEEFSTPGLSLFMQLPGPLNGITALDSMVAAARRIAAELHGELRDQSRNVLSKQSLEHLRTEIMEYQRRQRLGHTSS